MTYFTEGKNNIAYLGDNFTEWFGGMDDKPKKVELHSKKLERGMCDKEILEELKPSECTLGDIAYVLPDLAHDEWYIFYVKNKDGVLRAVSVFWCDGGWSVFAFSVVSPVRLDAGRHVFSRSGFNNETKQVINDIPLEITINGHKYIRA